MATKADLRNRALKKIGALSIGQTTSAEDAADVETVIDNLLEWLVVKNASTWGNDETLIPEEAQESFVILVADLIGPDFLVSTERQVLMKALASNALSDLHEQAGALRSGEPIKAEYF